MTEKECEPDRREVRVKPNSHQPTKAERSERIVVRKSDGSALDIDDAARAVLRQVRMVRDPDA